MRKIINFIFILILTSNAQVMADEVLPSSMTRVLKHSADIPGLFHIILSTLFMVVFIYAIAIIYHKLSKFNAKKFSGCEDKLQNLNKLKLINSMSLGPNKSLHVVEINNKFLVVGSTQTSINLLKEFDKNTVMFKKDEFSLPPEIDDIIESDNEQQEPSMKELNSLKGTKSNLSAELDFEKIYKKYI